MTKNKSRKCKVLLAVLLALMMAAMPLLSGCGGEGTTTSDGADKQQTTESREDTSSSGAAQPKKVETDISLSKVPEFSGEPYVEIKGNQPQFSAGELKAKSYETYSELDSLGRCGTARACIGRDLMPDEERGSIGMVKPSGWHTIRYDGVDGKYLYNRCHLIGYQLSGENANEENLITGTRYLNVEGMLPFEEEVAEYVKSTGNHVLYEVTPVFSGSELVARGVHMQAESVEDKGKGVSFNIYAYNNQPGITINYETGDSRAKDGSAGYSGGAVRSGDSTRSTAGTDASGTYIVNENTGKFHRPGCYSVKQMNPENRKKYKGKRQSLIDNGYEPCGNCNP
ncbi:MAG: DNA/RNA non-specific endonuclease [Anaerovoracaceae bacterium]|jgi:DNA-entry nuclease